LEFEPVIGFEVHAQLTTRSKIFCSSANEPGGPPNTRVCPVCLGMPGVLPVLNERAVDLGILVALALDADVAGRMGFARKNYFYPDLPKGYQITQFAEPLATGGHVDLEIDGATTRVGIRQIHIEEDAGKTIHAATAGEGASLVDMNRCGVPLVEIVTRPDVRSIDTADALLTKLRRILVFLGVATGRMHEGSLRFDTNVSLRPAGEEALGTATEIKNMNSFRAVRRALAFEIERQARVLASGGEVVHETLLWDEDGDRAIPMRSKEIASDYRYFPEPDLVDVVIDRERLERLRGAMPELPDAMRDRFVDEYGLARCDADVLTAELDTALYYEATVRELVRLLRPELDLASAGRVLAPSADVLGPPSARVDFRLLPLPGEAGARGEISKTAANWVVGKLAAWLNAADGIALRDLAGAAMPPSRLARVILSRLDGTLNEPAAKRLFEAAVESEDAIDALIERLDLAQVSDEGTLGEVVGAVLEEHPGEVARYRSGEGKLLGHFMGLVMKATNGKADPEVARAILEASLEDR